MPWAYSISKKEKKKTAAEDAFKFEQWIQKMYLIPHCVEETSLEMNASLSALII